MEKMTYSLFRRSTTIFADSSIFGPLAWKLFTGVVKLSLHDKFTLILTDALIGCIEADLYLSICAH